MWIAWLTKEFHYRLLLSPLTTRRLLGTNSDTTRQAWAERGNVWLKKSSTEDRPWQSPESIQPKHLSSTFLHSSHHPSPHTLTRVHAQTDSGCKFTRTLLSRSGFVLSVVDTNSSLPSFAACLFSPAPSFPAVVLGMDSLAGSQTNSRQGHGATRAWKSLTVRQASWQVLCLLALSMQDCK